MIIHSGRIIRASVYKAQLACLRTMAGFFRCLLLNLAVLLNNLDLKSSQMARKYVRETKQGSWNENDVEKAIQEAAKYL
jgi:hypothetical protein